MYEDFFYDRIMKLRMTKGVSSREMSLAMGQSEGYMTKIENRKLFPSMNAFFIICEYLEISPKDFFNNDVKYPNIINEINNDLNKLSVEQLSRISGIIKDIIR